MTPTNLTDQPLLLAQLQRWATLEPDRCKIENGFSKLDLRLKNSPETSRNLALLVLGDREFDSRDLAILQQAVQRAISARGLLYEFRNDSKGRFHALVQSLQDSHQSLVGIGEEPAISLLTAYLGSLTAQNP